jgi:hypothetical protein
MNKKNTTFNLTKQQQMEVEEKMLKLLEICQIYHVPMFSTVAVKNDDDGTVYNNILYGGRVHNINLKDDQIQRHILISNDFRAVPRREAVELDMSEVLSDE